MAIATLVLAGLLAMLANGETPEAFEAHVAESGQQKRLESAQPELAGKSKGGSTAIVFKDNRKNRAEWGADINTAPTDEFVGEEEEAPELRAAPAPRLVDVGGAVPASAMHAGVAPPGMPAQGLIALKKKNEKARTGNGLAATTGPAHLENTEDTDVTPDLASLRD